jgi:hypothetical protein
VAASPLVLSLLVLSPLEFSPPMPYLLVRRRLLAT